MRPVGTSRSNARLAVGGAVVGLLLLAVVFLVLLGDRETETGPPPLDAPSLGTPPPGLDRGTYGLGPEDVHDGDSLRVEGVGAVRVLGIDCEEIFRSPADQLAAERDFAAYARSRRGDAPEPVKFPTPAGEAAKDAAAPSSRLPDGCVSNATTLPSATWTRTVGLWRTSCCSPPRATSSWPRP